MITVQEPGQANVIAKDLGEEDIENYMVLANEIVEMRGQENVKVIRKDDKLILKKKKQSFKKVITTYIESIRLVLTNPYGMLILFGFILKSPFYKAKYFYTSKYF